MPRPNHSCADCGRPVLRVITMAGRRQLLNPDPDRKGSVALYMDAASTWRARVPNEDHPIEPWERLYMPHQATCNARLRPSAPSAAPAAVQLAIQAAWPEPAPKPSNNRSPGTDLRNRTHR